MTAAAAPAATAAPRALDRAAVMGILPHREPMLLLDRAPWFESGVRVIALGGDLASLAPAIPRDRPGEVPPELLIEASAQTAAILVVESAVDRGEYPRGVPQVGVLAAVPEFRFHAPVPNGAQTIFRAEVAKKVKRLWIVRCEVHANEALVATGTLSVAIGKPGEM
jgi:3-hydroxymyristoyl/3-hydroxydecanoyl-(acyl carrier protein) dehydratase